MSGLLIRQIPYLLGGVSFKKYIYTENDHSTFSVVNSLCGCSIKCLDVDKGRIELCAVEITFSHLVCCLRLLFVQMTLAWLHNIIL